MATLTEVFTNIANAIRNKRKFNKTDKFTTIQMNSAISELNPFECILDITTVPSATVTATHTTNGITTSGTSDSNGNIKLDISIPGTWKVVVIKGEYTYEKNYTTPSTTINFSLQYGYLKKLDINRLGDDKNRVATTTVGNNIIIAGGWSYTDNFYTNRVNRYNSSLTSSNLEQLSTYRLFENQNGVTVGNYAIIAGGYNNYKSSSDVDIYNNNCTKIATDITLSDKRRYAGETTISNYALIAAGDNANGSLYDTVDTISSSLVKGTAANLSCNKNCPGALTVGNYALFAGGYNSGYKDNVDSYNTSLTKGIATALSVGRNFITTTTIDNKGLFIGGQLVDTSSNVIDIYSNSLVRSNMEYSNTGFDSIKALTLKDYVICMGGRYYNNNSTIYTTRTTLFNKSLTSLNIYNYGMSNMRQYTYGSAGATLNNYALFLCGSIIRNNDFDSNLNGSDIVEAYEFLI